MKGKVTPSHTFAFLGPSHAQYTSPGTRKTKVNGVRSPAGGTGSWCWGEKRQGRQPPPPWIGGLWASGSGRDRSSEEGNAGQEGRVGASC